MRAFRLICFIIILNFRFSLGCSCSSLAFYGWAQRSFSFYWLWAGAPFVRNDILFGLVINEFILFIKCKLSYLVAIILNRQLVFLVSDFLLSKIPLGYFLFFHSLIIGLHEITCEFKNVTKFSIIFWINVSLLCTVFNYRTLAIILRKGWSSFYLLFLIFLICCLTFDRFYRFFWFPFYGCQPGNSFFADLLYHLLVRIN